MAKSSEPPNLYPPGDPDDPISAVTDMRSFYRKMGKLEHTLTGMVAPISQIPAIAAKVNETVERVTRVEEQLTTNQRDIADAHDRTDALEGKVDQDILHGVQHAVRLQAIEDDEKERKGAKLAYNVAMLGVLAALILGAVGAIYGYGKLSATMTSNAQHTKRLEGHIQQLPTKVQSKVQEQQAPVIDRVATVANQVSTSNGHAEAFESFCESMRSVEKRSVRRARLSKGQRVPQSCIE